MKTTRSKDYLNYAKTLSFLIVIAGILLYFMKENYGRYGYYVNYIVDFHIGFVSRALVGSIISLFSDSIVTESAAANFSFFSGLLTNIALFSLLCVVICKVNRKYQTFVFIVLLFFLLSPVLYKYYFTLAYGWLDVLWLLTFFSCILCLKNKYLSFMITVLCSLGISFHYAFSFLVLPSILALQYYEMHKSKFEKVRIFSFTLNIAVSLCLSIYYLLFATTKMTSEEFYAYVESKSAFGSNYWKWDEYWELFYYQYLKRTPSTATAAVSQWAKPSFPGLSESLEIFASVALLIIFFSTIWFIACRLSLKTGGKLLYIGLLLLPIFTSVIFFTGADYGRWVSAFSCSQFIVFFYLLQDEDSIVSKTILPNKKMRIYTLAGMFAAFLSAQYFGAHLP